jgi:lipopolysaccharide transport system permease protein
MRYKLDNYALAYQDFIDSLKKYKLWLHFGWTDIKLRYKGSILGPFWITLSMSIFILAIGIIYSHLLHQTLANYIPYLTCGFIIWNYISTSLIDSNEVFFNSKHFINHMRLPYLVFLYRIIWRNIIIFFHNSIVYLFVIFYFKVKVDYHILYFIPGFLLLTINLFFIALLISLIGTRYRDIPPVINSMLQIIFFVSPIAWMAKTINLPHLVLALNPVNYFLDIVRSPLLGEAPEVTSWIVCSGICCALCLIVTPAFAINRKRIPFWI